MALINGVDIQSVSFGPGQIEIVYMEERDVDSAVMEIRTIVVPVDLVEETAGEALDSIQQLLDSALIAKRSPKAFIRR